MEKNCTDSGLYQGADKSLARPTSRCILFDASLVIYIYIYIYIYSTNIPAIMVVSRIYEHQNLLLL